MMDPVPFAGQSVVYAKDQPEYLPLPAHRSPDGVVTSCWHLSWRERLRVAVSGRLWLSILTFNRPLQPLLPSAVRPEWVPQRPIAQEHATSTPTEASDANRHLHTSHEG